MWSMKSVTVVQSTNSERCDPWKVWRQLGQDSFTKKGLAAIYKVGKLQYFVIFFPWSFCVDLPTTAPWVWGKRGCLAVRCCHIFQQCSRKHDLNTSKDAEIEQITIDHLYISCEFCLYPQFDKATGKIQVWSTRAQESLQLLLLPPNFWPPKMRFGGQNCWLKVCFSK